MDSQVNKNPFWELLDQIYKVSSSRRSHLEGKLLTLVEAVARDEEQRNAFKSIVRETLWNWRDSEIRDIVCQFTEVFEGEKIENIGIEENSKTGGKISYFSKK